MLSAMTPELQKQNENINAKAIYLHLKELFAESARVEKYVTSRSLFSYRMQSGCICLYACTQGHWVQRAVRGVEIQDGQIPRNRSNHVISPRELQGVYIELQYEPA